MQTSQSKSRGTSLFWEQKIFVPVCEKSSRQFRRYGVTLAQMFSVFIAVHLNVNEGKPS